MSRNCLSIVGVPALAASALLFAASAGLAQKGGGHGGGSGGGHSTGASSASRAGPSASFRSSPNMGMRSAPTNSAARVPSNANGFRNGQMHNTDFRKDGDHRHDGDHHDHDGHDRNRNRNVIIWWGSPWWWGWGSNPWSNGWYDPWSYGGSYAFNSYPANYSSFYSGAGSYPDAGAMPYSDDGTNGSPTPGEVSADPNRRRDDSRPQIDDNAVMIAVRLPAEADLWFDGVKTTQTGPVRRFETPPLKPGQEYGYEIRARWMEDGHEVNQTRKVAVHAGDRLGLNFQSGQGNGGSAPR